jgi:hypothetical protein
MCETVVNFFSSTAKKRPGASFRYDDSPDPSTHLLAPENQDLDMEKGPASDEPRVEEQGGTWDFIWDGLSTIMRSALIQITFFLSLVCASRLGMYAVAAHQVRVGGVSPSICCMLELKSFITVR